MKTGAELIIEERQRQIDKEGWDPTHDDEHTDKELAKAAICYILSHLYGYSKNNCPSMWPWDLSWWKPDETENSIKNLKKAGALIAAEIDRIQRLEK